MSYKSVKDYRARLKERATYVLGEKCQCCGYDKCIQALEFHHLNPEEKEFNFNENTNRSWNSTREEIKKCILVCANCHREIHASLIDNSQLISSYDEIKAQEIDQLIEDIVTHKVYYCKTCGIEVYKGNEYCPQCANVLRRKVERPTREELKQLIYKQPFTVIARNFNVTDNAIRKWCKLYGLPTTKTEIQSYTEQEWEDI